MKGLHHSVIEIKDTQNREIEKILVFLRPGDHKIDVDATRQDAQEILQKVKITQRLPRLLPATRLFLRAVGLAVGAGVLLLFIF